MNAFSVTHWTPRNPATIANRRNEVLHGYTYPLGARGNLAVLEFETGNPAEGRRHLGRIAGASAEPTIPGFPCTLAKIARMTGGGGRAEALARILRDSSAAAAAERPLGWWESGRHVARARIALLRGDHETAAVERRYFARWTGCFLPLGLFGAAYDGLAGLLAADAGDLDDAIVRLRDAVTFCRTSGLQIEHAWCCLDLANAVLRRSLPGDRREAVRVTDRGRQIAASQSLRPLLAKLDDCRNRVSRHPARPSVLSARETEVLRLVTDGCTNRQIGDRLFISERTVATHVVHIFEKLGVSNRAAATAWAITNGVDGT